MWIRSQDRKKLLKCSGVWIREGNKIFCYHFEIEEDEENSYRYSLIGEYSTKEKALKVLDIIQEAIITKELFGATIIVEGRNYENLVFQMPLDEEVEG